VKLFISANAQARRRETTVARLKSKEIGGDRIQAVEHVI